MDVHFPNYTIRHPADLCIASDIDDIDHTGDPIDATDANTFEILSQEQAQDHSFHPVTPECGLSSGPRLSTPPLDNPIEPNPKVCNSETRPTVFIKSFPCGHPGTPVTGTSQTSPFESAHNGLGNSEWAPFESQCDWKIVRWAKMEGPTSTALMELLAIPEVWEYSQTFYSITDVQYKVVEKLGLSYSTSNKLNGIIDKALPGPPPFQCVNVSVRGKELEFHYRKIITSIQSLFSKPEFAQDLIYVPEQHYTDTTWTCCVYNKMHTGDWWWSVQVCN